MDPDQALTFQRQWNHTERPLPYRGGVVARWRETVATDPDLPAVLFDGDVVTRGAFAARVDRAAAGLRALGVGPDRFVALHMNRSIDLVTAIWAILAAGGAYVPLPLDAPAARLQDLIADIAPACVITDGSSPLPAIAAPVLTLADLEGISATAPPPAPDHAAYMIYTSGSTGRPKGVVIEHGALLNRIHWMHRTYGLSPSEVVAQKTPYTFDVSVWEFIWPLCVGGQLAVAKPGGHMSPRYLARFMAAAGVTHIHFVPSMLRSFLRFANFRETPLRHVFCSGEALPQDLVAAYVAASTAPLHNLYGPTEATIDVSAWTCTPADTADAIPIGRPIDNTQLYVLDDQGRCLGPGETGNLMIGGMGLAREYWRRPDLTTARFRQTALGRLYDTGDRAAFRADGALMYHGRQDDQVKLNGIRVELGEIEAHLRALPGVADAVAAVQDPGGAAMLQAWLVATDGQVPDLAALKTALAERLPAPLIPRGLHLVPAIPLTPSGKAARKVLLDALKNQTVS
ncbi:MAG: amino acid adenylation domain-containing protein [Magnetospiraceae bacterium]